jgi:hypothetical protein
MLSSFRMHWNLAAGWYPTTDVTYRTPASWLPRVLLGRSSDSRLLGAAVTATGYQPDVPVTKDHPVCTWLFVRLVGTLLDSPDHMRR